MNVGEVTTQLETTRFGFGFERNLSSNPSTQHARAFFLKLLPRRRNDVTKALFESSYNHFADFVEAHRDDVFSIKQRIEPAAYPLDTAVRIFVPSWAAIKTGGRLLNLRDALSTWADTFHLRDDWLLEHAVVTLRKQYISSLDRGLPHGTFTEEYWNQAITLGPCSEAIFAQHEVNEALRHEGLSDFTFKSDYFDFTVEGPFFKSIADFKREVMTRFRLEGGQSVRGERKVLEFALTSYLKRFEVAAQKLTLDPPRFRWAETNHFLWLIDYQLPPCKRYRELARESGKDEKTIREGVQKGAQLIALTLRSAQCDRHLGRPRGAKDSKPRFRAKAENRKMRGNAE